jgi:protein gp37
MAKTKIEWCDKVWNPVTGCTKISAGCKHCYAEVMAKRLRLIGQPNYADGFAVRTHPETIDVPIRWRKPSRIFVCSMADLFHEEVPDRFIDRVWATMLLAPHHTFMVLTKRATRMREYLLAQERYDRVISAANVIRAELPKYHLTQVGVSNPTTFPARWIHVGVSAENQEAAEERIPELLETPAAVRWVSAEPMLGPVDLWAFMKGATRDQSLAKLNSPPMPGLDWVVCGCESGPNARPMDLDWARSLRDRCIEANVPFFLKQAADETGRKMSMPRLDGVIWNEYPE